MIISSPDDFARAARRRLPPFLYQYIARGSFVEHTLERNRADLASIALRQRVLRNVADRRLETELLGETFAMPVALGPVGLTGMYARRGEVQAARAADRFGIPFTMSTVSLCPIDEVAPAIKRPMWFQLYVLKDHGFMRSVLDKARAAGVTTLVFTVDLPVTGIRYSDVRYGLSGPGASWRRLWQTLTHPRWAWDVGFKGRPHVMGNLSDYLGASHGIGAYIDWLDANFDSGISLKDLDWIREYWDGKLLIKGVLDPEDAREVVRFGADGIVVSNHGGRQLDGVLSTTRALPPIADAVQGDVLLAADSGVRNGLDVVRMLALGADLVLLGRPYAYALGAGGEAGVYRLLELIAKEMRVAMALTGVTRVADIDADCLAEAMADVIETNA